MIVVRVPTKALNARKTEWDTVFAARPASWLEGRLFFETQGRMDSPEEHLDALRLKYEENAFWKNCMIDHGGKIAKFYMKDK